METEKNNVFEIVIKYMLQGLVIAIIAYYVTVMYKRRLRKPTINEIFYISITAAFTMYLLDYFIEERIGAKLRAGFTL